MDAAIAARPALRPFIDKLYDVDVEMDVKYGVGGVDFDRNNGSVRYRDMKLDVYRPRTASGGPRPALILAFGGAYLRGSKSEEVFEGEAPSTSMAEYCREFARRGYVCFSIEYRLMQEDPDPGVTPILPPDLPYKSDRIDYVRGLLGFPPSTSQMVRDVLEAATDDMSRAVAFVRSRSHAFGVDVTRIAIGGFSAGGGIALNSAFAERAPVAAVVVLSGRIAIPVLQTYVRNGAGVPPALLFYGENDLPDIRDYQDGMREHLTKAGVDNQFTVVPGAGHFYLRTARTIGADGSVADVEDRIAEFLFQRLRLAQADGTDVGQREDRSMTVERLQAFADAWNRHDIEGLMSFMADDCVFEANSGAEVSGTTYRGRAEVRCGFMKAWQDYPDARWNNAHHAVSGNRGFSEWIFTGTHVNGAKTEVAGCDLFVFRGDRIVVKNSFRKRPI